MSSHPAGAPCIAINACAISLCTAPIMRDALASLPIPARLLSALLLLLGALMAPHAANLNPLILAFFYTATLWRLIAQRRPDVMPRRWLLFLLMITALVLVAFTTNLSDGRLAGIRTVESSGDNRFDLSVLNDRFVRN